MPITHAKVSAVSDSADASLVQPSDWNNAHVIDIFVDEETPSGTIDSTDGDNGNGTYTLASTPSPASSLRLYKNGILIQRTVQFNLSTNIITYVEGYKPRVGDQHVAYYRKA